MNFVANHLWQSTWFAVLVAPMAFALRRHSAQWRYRIWLAASLKFAIPFSILVDLGSRLEWRSAAAAAPAIEPAVRQISQSFAPILEYEPVRPTTSPLTAVALTIWIAVSTVIAARWVWRWARLHATLRSASAAPIEAAMPVMISHSAIEPGVFGIVRPVLLLPGSIASRLAPAQLRTILAHELCHVRRRDNLTAAFHMMLEAIFWFHPLVWWIGARLVEERERACDEEVLRQGVDPEAYAAGIVAVCKFYLESPLVCAAGVSGADLKRRIRTIMTARVIPELTRSKKAALAMAMAAMIALPLALGVFQTTHVYAQDQSSTGLRFEVASIKPGDPMSKIVHFESTPGNGLRASGLDLQNLVAFAYDVPPFRISGSSGWMTSDRYEILAKPDREEAPARNDEERKALTAHQRERLRTLLAERFKLAVHIESKEFAVYALVVDKKGHKLRDPKPGGFGGIRGDRAGGLIAENCPLSTLVSQLTRSLGRTVVDDTGLIGRFDFNLIWDPAAGNSPDASGPTLFTALPEQVGLRLESRRGPLNVVVIDHAEKPTAN